MQNETGFQGGSGGGGEGGGADGDISILNCRPVYVRKRCRPNLDCKQHVSPDLPLIAGRFSGGFQTLQRSVQTDK